MAMASNGTWTRLDLVERHILFFDNADYAGALFESWSLSTP